MMDFNVKKWSHDWKHFNFEGESVKEDGMSNLSWNEVMEYMEWLSINEPKSYGRVVTSLGAA